MANPRASKAILNLQASDTRPPKKRLIRGVVKRAAGRPETTITGAGLECVERMARDGHSDVSIAKALGISKQCLVALKQRDERVQTALDQGRASLEDELTDVLLDIARDKSRGMQQFLAACYLTKSRCGWTEGQAPETRPNVTIVLPDSQSPADYMARLNAINTRGELPE